MTERRDRSLHLPKAHRSRLIYQMKSQAQRRLTVTESYNSEERGSKRRERIDENHADHLRISCCKTWRSAQDKLRFPLRSPYIVVIVTFDHDIANDFFHCFTCSNMNQIFKCQSDVPLRTERLNENLRTICIEVKKRQDERRLTGVVWVSLPTVMLR